MPPVGQPDATKADACNAGPRDGLERLSSATIPSGPEHDQTDTPSEPLVQAVTSGFASGSWAVQQTSAVLVLVGAKAGPHVWGVYHALCRARDCGAFPTHAMIGDSLGMSREQVSRSLSKLRALGLVTGRDVDGITLAKLAPVNLRDLWCTPTHAPVRSSAQSGAVQRTSPDVHSSAQPCAVERTNDVRSSAHSLYIETGETGDRAHASAREDASGDAFSLSGDEDPKPKPVDLSTKAGRDRHYPTTPSKVYILPSPEPPEFREFIDAYPGDSTNSVPGHSYKPWREIVVNGDATPEELTRAARAYAKSDAPRAGKIRRGSSWLREGDWVGWLEKAGGRRQGGNPNGKINWRDLGTEEQGNVASNYMTVHRTDSSGPPAVEWFHSLPPAEQRRYAEELLPTGRA